MSQTLSQMLTIEIGCIALLHILDGEDEHGIGGVNEIDRDFSRGQFAFSCTVGGIQRGLVGHLQGETWSVETGLDGITK